MSHAVESAAAVIPDLRGAFSSGSGRLAIHGNRIVFTENSELAVALEMFMHSVLTQREFFMACVERWFGVTSRPNLIVVWVEMGHTAVLAVGHRSAIVVTDTDEGVVDPAGASFAAERIFRGALRTIEIGEQSELSSLDCFVRSGIVAVGAVRVSTSDLATPDSKTSGDTKSGVAGVATSSIRVETPTSEFDSGAAGATGSESSGANPDGPTPDGKLLRSPINLETAATQRNDLVGAVADSTRSHEDSGVHPTETSEFDDLEGMTVWPSAPKASAPLAPREPQQPMTAAVTIDIPAPEVPAREVLAPEVPSTEALGSFHTDETVIVNLSDSAGEWEPPAPYQSNLDETRIVPQAPMWAPAPTLVSGLHAGPAADPELYPEELTIMAGDIDRVRKSFVDMVAPAQIGDMINVLGAYCGSGHFTDSRSTECFFCGSEIDFSKIETRPRPALGVLAFDDGRSVTLGSNVVVGRKPTSGESRSELVAFEDDKMLSRVHAEIRLVDWNVMVVDRQSVNGTTIEHGDGRKLTARPNIETKLDDGSVVRFGSHSCTYRKLT
jgi:hypothetical protein